MIQSSFFPRAPPCELVLDPLLEPTASASSEPLLLVAFVGWAAVDAVEGGEATGLR